MGDAEASRAHARAARRSSACQLAIDDFGTGYSSLAYLKQFPVDVLKIDRTFVDGLPDDAEDIAIVTTIIRLAESLGMVVTAEGIETTEQAETLLELGCRVGPGLPVRTTDARHRDADPARRAGQRTELTRRTPPSVRSKLTRRMPRSRWDLASYIARSACRTTSSALGSPATVAPDDDDPDAPADDQLGAVAQGHGLRHLEGHAERDVIGLALGVDLGTQHHELVAADAARRGRPSVRRRGGAIRSRRAARRRRRDRGCRSRP